MSEKMSFTTWLVLLPASRSVFFASSTCNRRQASHQGLTFISNSNR